MNMKRLRCLFGHSLVHTANQNRTRIFQCRRCGHGVVSVSKTVPHISVPRDEMYYHYISDLTELTNVVSREELAAMCAMPAITFREGRP